MLNRIILIGRLATDPEMRFTRTGLPYTRFRLAVERSYTNQQGERDADFIPITAWRRTAELCKEHLQKGQLVAIEGKLQMRNYETNEGERRTIYDVVADTVQFLEWGRPRSNDDTSGNEETEPESQEKDSSYKDLPSEPEEANNQADDDLPFY